MMEIIPIGSTLLLCESGQIFNKSRVARDENDYEIQNK